MSNGLHITCLLAVDEYNSDKARTRSEVWPNVQKHKQYGLYEVSEKKNKQLDWQSER